MGVADLIPGFSGGTVAFIVGIYPDLVRSILTLNSHTLRLLLTLRIRDFFRSTAWEFLSALALGIVISALTFVHAIRSMLAQPKLHTYLMAAFFGLVVASVVICGSRLRRWGAVDLLLAFLGALFALCSVLGALNRDVAPGYDIPIAKERVDLSVEAYNYNPNREQLLNVPPSTVKSMILQGVISPTTSIYTHKSGEPSIANQIIKQSNRYIDPFLILSGAVAVSALLLPGISGSYILIILGVYPVIIGALADQVSSWINLSFDGESFRLLVNFTLGIILGLLLFSRLIDWLMQRYFTYTIATIIGFLVGALPAVWPFWSYSYYLFPLTLTPKLQIEAPALPNLFASYFWISLVLAIAAFTLALFMERKFSRR